MHLDLDTSKFQIKDIVKATGVDAGLLRSWFTRGYLVLHPTDEAAPEKGLARKFSLRTVYQVAVVSQLNRFGMLPQKAKKYATLVTDRNLQGRSENLLFPFPKKTFLVITGVSEASVISLGGEGENWYYCLFPLDGAAVSVIHIDLNALLKTVDLALAATDGESE